MREDLTGKKYGRWEVIGFSHYTRNQGYYWNCTCECGTEKPVQHQSLIHGKSKSCGCYNKDRARELFTTHGCSGIATYSIWRSMKSRCYDIHHKHYSNYGGRGIKICPAWHKFENFLTDMGECPADMTLDRKDNNGDYELENCRWASRSEQNRNSRRNINITIEDKTQCLEDWCHDLDLNASTIRNRIQVQGKDPVAALLTPVRYVGARARGYKNNEKIFKEV